jgi:hypothetical protein
MMEFFILPYDFQLRLPSNFSTINKMKLIREEVIRRWDELGLLNGVNDVITVQPLAMPTIGRLFWFDFVYEFPRKKYKIAVILK